MMYLNSVEHINRGSCTGVFSVDDIYGTSYWYNCYMGKNAGDTCGDVVTNIIKTNLRRQLLKSLRKAAT